MVMNKTHVLGRVEPYILCLSGKSTIKGIRIVHVYVNDHSAWTYNSITDASYIFKGYPMQL